MDTDTFLRILTTDTAKYKNMIPIPDIHTYFPNKINNSCRETFGSLTFVSG